MKTEPKRTRFVGVRFTPEEFAQLETLAQAAQVELSAYIRHVLVKAKAPQRARNKSPNIAALGQALVALNRIGTNINQIAHQANIAGNADVYRQAQDDRKMLITAAQAVIAAMEN
ncbi:hypothetical protein CCAX7_46240 [Capsulimonas corticalis]|uniref:Uncharacterized protein n=1 Tax=Capsulimonas corticalis TaxID=2219043 RepID=A0A402D530_9BACT|nr:plasmid mobilization relaxosome protein MobC [Capsulimonas corticalis]BDI32573.1 hypothetical protein CCAX7_46240 [Capsulimonas corticalis]